jgi:hypothetical protein
MIILVTFVLGMSLFTALIAFEWVCKTYADALDAFSQPLYRFERDWRDYMAPAFECQRPQHTDSTIRSLS